MQDEIPAELNTTEFKKTWNEYLEWRKEMGKSFAWKKPQNTKKRWLKKLSEWGHDSAIDALEHCMNCEYQGLFPAPYKRPKKESGKAASNQLDERWRDFLKVALKESP